MFQSVLYLKEVYSQFFTHKPEKSWGGGFSERSAELRVHLKTVLLHGQPKHNKTLFHHSILKMEVNDPLEIQKLEFQFSMDNLVPIITVGRLDDNKILFKDVIHIYCKHSLLRNDFVLP